MSPAQWSKSHADAMAEAARCDIPPDDAESMWTKYVSLGDEVRAGTMTDADALKAFGKFCTGLAQLRAVRTLFSPRLDVITGKLR